MKKGDVTISTKTLIVVIIIAIVAISLVVSFITDLGGLISRGEVITTTQEASEAITNVSSGVEDLTRTLEDIDRSLG